jgi:hypothetical protein
MPALNNLRRNSSGSTVCNTVLSTSGLCTGDVEVSTDAKAGAPIGALERVVPVCTPYMHSSTLLDSLDTYIGIQ